jgi:hypothetical protein
MVFNDELVFIHIGKTGGLSCAKYLLHSLQSPIYNCHVDAKKESLQITDRNVIPVTSVNRHCTLRSATQLIERLSNRPVAQKKKILAVIRNPFDLEYSFYRHLRKPRVIKRRALSAPALVELAKGNFKEFVRKSDYHRAGLKQEDYFLIDGKVPDNVEIIRHENLKVSFLAAVAPYVDAGVEFPHINQTNAHEDSQPILDDELREIIYRKHQYIIDNFYSSEMV